MRPKEIGGYEFEVYEDTETEAMDSFSVVVDGEDVIALGETAGFDQFAGSLPPKGKISRDNLGERIKWENTPDAVKEALYNRFEIPVDEVDQPALPSKKEVKEELKKIAGQAGMLFQSHPTMDDWETTRPGAMEGEVFALKNDELGIHRLSMRYFDEGESIGGADPTDEELWIVEVMDDTDEIMWGSGNEQDFFYDRDKAFNRMAELMLNITEERA